MASILVVSDYAEELNTAREQLSGTDGTVIYSHSAQETATLVITHHPLLLVLAYSDLDIASKSYAALLRSIPENMLRWHRTLLLCKSREAETAHSRCVDGTFDDYVVNRPLQDPRRIDLSVRQLIARSTAGRDSQEMSQRLADVGDNLQQLDETARPVLGSLGHHHAALSHGIENLPELLSQVLDQFRDLLRSGPTPGPDQLRAQLEDLLKNCIDPEIQNLLKHLTSSSTLLAELESRITTLTGSLKKPPSSSPEVVIVDDDAMYRTSLRQVVESSGMRAVECPDGHAALLQLRRSRPDLVLLDQEMPGMSGLDLLHMIRSDSRSADIPVIMLTGVGTRDIVRESIAAGIQGFIAKPSKAVSIIEKIRQVLGRPGR